MISTEKHTRALLMALSSLGGGAPCEGGSVVVVVVVVVDVLNEKSPGVPPRMASHCSRVLNKDSTKF